MGILTAALGFFLGAFWPFEIFAHFRLQSIGALLITGSTLCFMRRKALGLVCCAMSLMLAGTVVPYFYPRAQLAKEAQLKLLGFNVNTANTRFAEVMQYIGRQEADVVFLMEVNEAWVSHLEELKALYPHQIIHPREDNFGLAVLSKQPFLKEEILSFTVFDLPAAAFEVSFLGTNYHIIAAHPLPPASAFNFEARNAELRDLARRIAPFSHAVFMGDFNLTPFSPYFREIVQISGLRDSSLGLGFSPTWLSANPLFALPIDHILISKDLDVAYRAVGPPLGSDHNPLVLGISPRKGSTDHFQNKAAQTSKAAP